MNICIIIFFLSVTGYKMMLQHTLMHMNQITQSVIPVISSNRLAVTVLMDRHDAMSLSSSVSLCVCLSLSLSVVSLLFFHLALLPNQASILILKLFDIYTKISEPG